MIEHTWTCDVLRMADGTPGICNCGAEPRHHQDTRVIRAATVDPGSEIEWIKPDPPVTVDMDSMPGARALVVGPDEILVVVLPQFVNGQQLEEHRQRLRQSLGDRFAIVVGSDVQLAKVKTEDWATPAIPQSLGRDSGTNLGDLNG